MINAREYWNAKRLEGLFAGKKLKKPICHCHPEKAISCKLARSNPQNFHLMSTHGERSSRYYLYTIFMDIDRQMLASLHLSSVAYKQVAWKSYSVIG